MSRLPLSRSIPSALRRSATPLVAMVGFVLFSSVGSAQQQATLDVRAELVEPEPEDVDEAWRAKGLAHVDFPLGIRARFDAAYASHVYSADGLARPYVDHVGPEIRTDRTLQSRIALTRPIVQGVEIELAWETRNSLELSDPMGFGRQTIGARIRISP